MLGTRKNLLPPASIVLGLAGVLLFSPGCSRQAGEKAKAPRDESIPVTVTPVEMVPLDRTLQVVGTLHPMNEASIAAQVEGQIEKTEVDFGDHASAGQELARIDTASYEALARQSAATLVKAQANALNAEQSLKRVLELQKSKISSGSDLDSATALAEQARAEVKAVEATDAIAHLNLKRSHVCAPFAGTVSERMANSGDYVKTGSSLFKLVEDSELKFVVQAPERYAAELKTGQLVQFSVDAWPGQTFEGKVYLISPSVTTSTRSFNFAARVPNAERKLKAYTFARGDLIITKAVPTPVVPLASIVNFAGVTKVFVVRDNVARSREVKTGRVHEGRQEILEGLEPGEAVVSSGITKLYENARIRLLTSTNVVASLP